MKVLLVDDSAMIRMILKGLLKQMGVEQTEEAPDGAAALEKLNLAQPDLLLMDIHMPKLTGLQVLEQLSHHETLSKLPVIIVSSDTEPAQLEHARKLGARAIIHKPFRVEGLRDAMAQCGLKPPK